MARARAVTYYSSSSSPKVVDRHPVSRTAFIMPIQPAIHCAFLYRSRSCRWRPIQPSFEANAFVGTKTGLEELAFEFPTYSSAFPKPLLDFLGNRLLSKNPIALHALLSYDLTTERAVKILCTRKFS